MIRVEAERIPVRLGHNAFTSGMLDAETIDRAVTAFVPRVGTLLDGNPPVPVKFAVIT